MIYPGTGKPRLLAGMSPHSGVSQVPRALPVGLHNKSNSMRGTLMQGVSSLLSSKQEPIILSGLFQ
jgi:hypothetical protein